MTSVIHGSRSRGRVGQWVAPRGEGRGRKALATALAAFWLFWTAIVIPAHTRGCVPLNGVANAGVASLFGGGCCACERPPVPSKDHSTPERNSGGNCAICSFVAKLSAGTGFTTTLPAMGLLEIAAAPSPERLLAGDYFQIFNSRAPPQFPAC